LTTKQKREPGTAPFFFATNMREGLETGAAVPEIPFEGNPVVVFTDDFNRFAGRDCFTGLQMLRNFAGKRANHTRDW
jgi:hypothetical protein